MATLMLARNWNPHLFHHRPAALHGLISGADNGAANSLSARLQDQGCSYAYGPKPT